MTNEFFVTFLESMTKNGYFCLANANFFLIIQNFWDEMHTCGDRIHDPPNLEPDCRRCALRPSSVGLHNWPFVLCKTPCGWPKRTIHHLCKYVGALLAVPANSTGLCLVEYSILSACLLVCVKRPGIHPSQFAPGYTNGRVSEESRSRYDRCAGTNVCLSGCRHMTAGLRSAAWNSFVYVWVSHILLLSIYCYASPSVNCIVGYLCITSHSNCAKLNITRSLILVNLWDYRVGYFYRHPTNLCLNWRWRKCVGLG